MEGPPPRKRRECVRAESERTTEEDGGRGEGSREKRAASLSSTHGHHGVLGGQHRAWHRAALSQCLWTG